MAERNDALTRESSSALGCSWRFTACVSAVALFTRSDSGSGNARASFQIICVQSKGINGVAGCAFQLPGMNVTHTRTAQVQRVTHANARVFELFNAGGFDSLRALHPESVSFIGISRGIQNSSISSTSNEPPAMTALRSQCCNGKFFTSSCRDKNAHGGQHGDRDKYRYPFAGQDPVRCKVASEGINKINNA